ncbi:MAG: hypothetical protein JWO78_2121 [Micavibrio sp.]|nr:hypothetical protein [Micavibrio sp.]
MPKDAVFGLSPVTVKEAYPARFDLDHWDDPYPMEVMKAVHPVAEAFEIARQHWGEQAGTYATFESGAYRCNYPVVKKPTLE